MGNSLRKEETERPQKTIPENVRGVTGTAASGVTARVVSNVAGNVANAVSNGVASDGAAKDVNGKVDSVEGMNDGSRPVIGAQTGAVKDAARAPSGAVKGAAGAPSGAVKGAAGAQTGVAKGAAGAPNGQIFRGTIDKAAEIDPLVVAGRSVSPWGLILVLLMGPILPIQRRANDTRDCWNNCGGFC
ncbi:hypothetical protein OIU76_026555 [Salix suchowensis]|nr:hypothetical protein OIU76_026555 [Salix suchowensis]